MNFTALYALDKWHLTTTSGLTQGTSCRTLCQKLIEYEDAQEFRQIPTMELPDGYCAKCAIRASRYFSLRSGQLPVGR